jgi:hypothetical protein
MLRILMAATAAIVMSAAALANNYNFNLHNQANGWVIDGFYTYQNGKWSKNWLQGARIQPSQYVGLAWNSQAGECVVPFRVSWVGYGSQDFTMDWCKNNPTNIYMLDESFTWD